MKRFPATMILLALAGTAAVYFGVPHLRELVEVRSRVMGSVRMRIRSLSDALTGKSASQSEFRDNIAEETREKTGAGGDRGERIFASRNDPGVHDEPAPSVVAGDPAWGVLRQRTRSFNRQGKFLRFLPGGVLLEKIDRHESSIGLLAECRVWFERQWTEGVFIPDAALVTFEGTAEQAPQRKRETLRRYFSLRDALQRLLRELDGKLDRDHPLLSEYHEAKKDYEALHRRARELQTRRDREEGGARIEQINTLADMRQDIVLAEQRLRQAAESVRQERERNQRRDPSRDKELERLQSELTALEPIVREWLDDV